MRVYASAINLDWKRAKARRGLEIRLSQFLLDVFQRLTQLLQLHTHRVLIRHQCPRGHFRGGERHDSKARP
jgi:hypothetical protein